MDGRLDRLTRPSLPIESLRPIRAREVPIDDAVMGRVMEEAIDHSFDCWTIKAGGGGRRDEGRMRLAARANSADQGDGDAGGLQGGEFGHAGDDEKAGARGHQQRRTFEGDGMRSRRSGGKTTVLMRSDWLSGRRWLREDQKRRRAWKGGYLMGEPIGFNAEKCQGR